MPITGVLDLQRRSLPLGEIRIGSSEPIPGKNGRKPVRLETFRFTTQVEETANAVSARFGGTPAPWDRHPGYWVVDTDQSVIEVWVPPRGKAVDAWMEMWDERKCLRRCDGITEQRSGGPCLCPQPQDRTDPASVARAAEERKRLAALKPPRGCKPLTRISVQIPCLPGMTGVWVLRTGSANAAVETADTGEVLGRARDMDVYLPALLLIHWRPGQDGHPYPVLTLRLRPSTEQVAQLPVGMDGMLAQIGNGDGPGFRAITSGKAAAESPPRAGVPVQAKQRQAPSKPARTAQDIADDAANATTRDEITGLAAEMKEARAEEDFVCTDPENDLHEELQGYLREQYRRLPAGGGER